MASGLPEAPLSEASRRSEATVYQFRAEVSNNLALPCLGASTLWSQTPRRSSPFGDDLPETWAQDDAPLVGEATARPKGGSFLCEDKPTGFVRSEETSY